MPRTRERSLEVLETRQLLASMIYDLGTLGGNTSQATAINDVGQVVGTSQTADGSEQAFIWSLAQGIQPLKNPSSFPDSTATGINNSGQVAVTVYTSTPGDGNAYLDSSGTWTNLGTLPGGTAAAANAINNSGEVVGGADVGGVQAFLYNGGSLIGLGTLPGIGGSTAVAINNFGQAAGDSGTNAVLFSGGVTKLTSFLSSGRTIAFGINDSGEIVGQSIGLVPGTTNLQVDAFLYSDGVMTSLGPGIADGINNMGQVVGTNGSYPVLWENRNPVALSSLLPANSGWTLSTATAINNEGQVVGVGTINGQTHAYMLNIDQTSQAFTVSNLNDSGPGSLRDAIDQANDFVSSIGRALITLSTSLDFGTISLLSALPAITRDDVTIDGPLTLDAVSGDGLDLDAPGDIVQGLTITGFSGSGIVVNGGDALLTDNTITGNGEYGIDVESSGNTIGAASTQGIGPSFGGNLLSGNGYSGILVFSSEGNLVEGNLIGTDATGTVAQGNTDGGVYLWNAAGNTIGGTSAAARNIISGNASAAYAGVNVYESLGNVVEGNDIGTDISGSVALGNQNGVDISNDSEVNTIGGTTGGSGNVISGNAGYGVFITGSGTSQNLVAGNFIGTDHTGLKGLGNLVGVAIQSGSASNTVGGTIAGAGNLISGNTNYGIDIDGSGTSQNVVASNWIGIDAKGSIALPNGIGIAIFGGSTANTIGARIAGFGNVISGNATVGIEIDGTGTSQNLVAGNFIGTDDTGEKGLGNASNGIDDGGVSNTIGGTTAGARNIISGNQGYGIQEYGTDELVAGNFVGTGATGETALGNAADGILGGGVSNTIGGTTAGARNVISGNSNYGIYLDATDDLVEGDYIGTDATGKTALMNGSVIITNDNGSIEAAVNDGTGVYIGFFAPGCTVGGTAAGARNLISGNMIAGVVMDDASGDLVEGNYIGTDVTGTAALGNGYSDFVYPPNVNGYSDDFFHASGGVVVSNGATLDTIGGTTAGAGNLISGNADDGVNISDEGFDQLVTGQIVVSGNLIGTDASGTAPVPNTGSGVDIVDGAQSNTIGGTTSGAGNIIAFNMLNGVTVGYASYASPNPDTTAGNSILENSIFSNGVPSAQQGPFDMQGIGIDLGDNGVTQNDSSGDVGPNLYQVFPDLSGVVTSDGVTTITGAIYANPNTTYRIEFFSNPAADPSGYGQGQTFLMATYVTTDYSGEADFELDTPSAVGPGQFIAATATDPAGNTSEFSADVENSGLAITEIAAVSPNPRNTPVSAVDVTLNEYVGASFTIGALSLTDNGGPNLINAAVTVSVVPGSASTYQVGGLAGLTTAEGAYSLTVDATQIEDFFGNLGNGSVSTSWLMDTTPPTSTIDPLPLTTTATTFTVSASGSDPTGSNGSTPSGIASYALYDSTDNGPFTLFATVTPSSPSTTFTGEVGQSYGFYSVATDNAGNVQPTPDSAQQTVEILSALALKAIAPVSPNPRKTPVSAVDVTFSEPVKLSSFTANALTLTDNGASNLITSALSITLVSGATYQIGGLTGLTAAEGTYSLTVNAADIDDQSGNPGSGSLSASWLMDTTPPTSKVSALPAQTTSTSFTVSVSGSDPSGANGSTPSGVSSYAIYDSKDNGAFARFASVPAANPSALFTGQPGHSYGFYSVATDNAGNVQATPAAAQATVQILSPVTVTSIAAIAPNPRNTPVSTLDVTFSMPVNLTTFTDTALTLTDNGGPNLITSAVTVSLVSDSTYQINGLAALTKNNGDYTLTVNSAPIEDMYGNAGSGSLSTSWLMDTTAPESTVNPLPKRGTSLNFTVSVTGSDGGSPPSGLKSFDIYSSTDGGPWVLWTSVPASNPSATFTGQSNTTYSFYSIAQDLAGNIESNNPSIEASTYLPDLTPPVTSVDSATAASNPSSINTTTGTFTLNLTGNDPGGGLLIYFEVFASVDGGAYKEVGPYAIPAGAADSKGNYHSTMIYQGLTDGTMHTYAFYSVGLDSAGNLQAAPASANVTFQQKFAAITSSSQLQVTGFTVEHGSPSRSYVRYLDLTFDESDSQSGGELTSIVNSIGTSSPDILIYKYDLNGDASSKTAVALGSPTVLDVLDHAIEIDFGSGGIGGNPSTTSADGYYEVDIKLPNGQTAVHHFYRLLGDVHGDGTVDQNDLSEIAADVGATSQMGWGALSADVTGTGTVTTFELTIATRSKGRKLGTGLSLG